MASETYTINSATGIDYALRRIDYRATNIVNAGGIAYATISDEPEDIRTGFDNSKFHAIMSDIWKQAVIMQGRSFEACKASLVLAFCRELESMGEEIPKYMKIERTICPLTKETVSIRPSTTKFSKKWAQQFCQFLWATGSDIGVSWSDKASQEYESMINSGQV